MKRKWGLVLLAALVVIAPFFIHVYPAPRSPSFNYFLHELEFIEDTLTSIGMNLHEHPTGDFTLESVLAKLGLKDQYLEHFESDPEKAQLTNPPFIDFAFHDSLENPIRIWIDGQSYRVYSPGPDGRSSSGGLDADDIWTGEAEKARDYIHNSYHEWWLENNRRNLWAHLFECLK